MNQFVIAPSILSADFTRLGEELAECEAAGADWIHVDVMDGHFVPNITMGPFIVKACRRATDMPLDVHLMIEKPERHLRAFAEAGATGLTVHAETCPDLAQTLKDIKALGCRAGVAFNPDTPVARVEPVLPLADLVLVMSVFPGFSGQEFMPGTVAKAADVRSQLDALGSSAWLEVDGGISAETLPVMKEAGATVFAAASAVFKHPQGTKAGIRELRALL